MPRRAASRSVTLTLIIALAFAGCDLPKDPVTGCPAPGGTVVLPPDGAVAAGETYQASPGFPPYPCVQGSNSSCGWVTHWPGIPIWECDSTAVQGSCQPGLTVIAAPAGVEARSASVWWRPGRADEGQTARIEVETVYPEGCQQQRAAWSVSVLPGPPLPSFRSLVLDREEIRVGETVTVVADFDGELASWDFGPLARGVPATSPPLSTSRRLTFQVTGGLSDVVTEQRLISAWPPPEITRFYASATRAPESGFVDLLWEGSGLFSLEPAPSQLFTGRALVQVFVTTTYVLTAHTPLGDRVSAALTIVVVPPPALHAFEALPAEVAVGGAPVLLASFEGMASLELVRGATGWTRLGTELVGFPESGVGFTAPAQRGTDRYRLRVGDGLGREVSAELTVPVVGSGSFALLPGVGVERPRAPILVPLPDGRLLLVGGTSDEGAPARAEYLDLTTGTAAPGGHPDAIGSAAALGDGRVVLTESPAWSQALAASTWRWGAPLALVDPGLADLTTWATPPDPAVAEALRGATLVGLGGARVLALGRAPVVAATMMDLDAGTFTPAALEGGVATTDGAACRLADGRVLLAGGGALFDPVSGLVSSLPVQAPSTGTPGLLCLRDGTALRWIQGRTYPVPRDVTWTSCFDPLASTWSGPYGEGPPRLAAAVELPDGHALFIDPTNGWVLDPGTATFSQVGRLALPRDQDPWTGLLRAARLADGAVVVHGSGVGWPERYTP